MVQAQYASVSYQHRCIYSLTIEILDRRPRVHLGLVLSSPLSFRSPWLGCGRLLERCRAMEFNACKHSLARQRRVPLTHDGLRGRNKGE